MQNEIVKGSTTAVAEKNITDKVLNQVISLEKNGGLVLPKNYSAENALKSAYLVLSESNLLNTDQTALAKALLDMCIQGLNPSKKQCYFINYGGKVGMMRSYHGDRSVAILAGLVKDVQAHVIYEGDEVNTEYVDGYLKVEHKTKFENWNKNIIGAYAMATMPDGTKVYDLMPIERIKKSWGMSKNQSNNKLQNQFTDDACMRTVTRHLIKNIFNQSNDCSLVIDSAIESDAANSFVEENAETKFDNVIDVKTEQVEKTASKKVVIEHPTPQPQQEAMPFDEPSSSDEFEM